MASFSPNLICPHCDRELSAGGGSTREHVFPETFKGRTTVNACADCNSGVGSGVEGRLLGSSSFMTFVQQGSGLPHKEMKASNSQGDFSVDLETGRHTAKLQVDVTELDGAKTYQIFGTPEDARRVLEGLARDGAIPADQIDAILEAGRVDPTKSENLTMTISLDLVLVRRLIAKIALCALTYLQGDEFIATDMAAWLRQVLDAPRHWGRGLAKEEQPDPAGVGAIDYVDADRLFNSFWDMYQGINERESIDPSDDVCQLIIWPVSSGEGSTTIFAVSLLDVILPTGLVAPGKPNAMFAPTTFSDRKDGDPVIRDCARGLPNGY